MYRGWLSGVLAACALGLASVGADLIWYHYKVPHTMVNGLVHGGLLFLVMGFVLGFVWRTSRALRWAAVVSLLIGILAAGSFYVLKPLVGWVSVFLAWMLLWPMFAWLRRWCLSSSEPVWLTWVRGLSAAVASGAVFYLVSWMWTDPPEGGPAFLPFFLCWSAAFLPGMLALSIDNRPAKME